METFELIAYYLNFSKLVCVLKTNHNKMAIKWHCLTNCRFLFQGISRLEMAWLER